MATQRYDRLPHIAGPHRSRAFPSRRDLVDRIAIVHQDRAPGAAVTLEVGDVAEGLLPPVQPVCEPQVDRLAPQGLGLGEERIAGVGHDRAVGRRVGDLGRRVDPDDTSAGLDERQRMPLVHPDLDVQARTEEFVHSPQELDRKQEVVAADEDEGKISLGEIPVVVDDEPE